jgi:hypothetical protein
MSKATIISGNDKAASLSKNDGGFLVVFGAQCRGEFMPSYAKPSRIYKTEATARKAASKWCGL